MDEYNIRVKIKNFIQNGISIAIEKYYKRFENNIGFLLYYPLINVEMRFIEEDPNFTKAIIDREQTNWLIREIFKYNKNDKQYFTYNQAKFDYYKNELYPQVAKMYSDFKLSKEIEDCNSLGRCKIEELDNGKYKLTTALVTNKYNGDMSYYFGLDNKEQIEIESEGALKPTEYLAGKYRSYNYKTDIRYMRRLKIDIDKELYSLCEKRVDIDTSKLGETVKSQIINKKETLNKVLGFLYYLSLITVNSFRIERELSNDVKIGNCIANIDKIWLINKIQKETGLHIELIKKYIDYLTYNGVGTVFEFPLINYGTKIIIIPSLIMLNDWQFSITNGHHAKKIEFIKKEKNISKSIVENICRAAEKFNNIIVTQELYYEYKNDEKKVNSDIDIALYDINTNKVLIIECKWKYNHYIDDTDKNYIKIQDTLNTIYKEQIYKHKGFLNQDKKNIDYVFKDDERIKNINVVPEIYYLAVDKRSEFHTEEYHMTSVYTLLTLFTSYSPNQELNIELLMSEISGLRTKVEYFMAVEPKEFIINDEDKIVIVNDELYGDYD